MRTIRIEKITLNIGCGSDLPIAKAKTVLERLTKRKIIITKTRKRTTFGGPKGKDIGCKVTLRDGKKELLEKLLDARDRKLLTRNFDSTGNFAFGVKEYIDIKGMEYDPTLGAIGMDVCVTLERPGYRVKKRKLASRVGKSHIITKNEAIEFVKKEFQVIVE